jgi:hypothetical protein
VTPIAYAKIAAVVLLLAAIFYGGYHVADLRGKAALASLQNAWDTNKAAIQATTDKAIAQATKDKETAQAANEVISHDYEAQLLAANTSAGNLARELRDARARLAANSGTVQQTPSQSIPPSGATSPGMGRTDELLGGALAECAAVRAGYKALIAEITPQL